MELTFFGFIMVAFIAWLMWSSEDQKKAFLFYSWCVMLLCIIGQVIYYIVRKI